MFHPSSPFKYPHLSPFSHAFRLILFDSDPGCLADIQIQKPKGPAGQPQRLPVTRPGSNLTSEFSRSVPSTRLNTGIGVLSEGCVYVLRGDQPVCFLLLYIYYVLDFSRIQCADNTVLETVLVFKEFC